MELFLALFLAVVVTLVAAGVTAVRGRRVRGSWRRRDRLAYIGAKFGSATITSWPSDSRWRATHSRSVLA
ncbi:MAG TPA: hypothetical protein VIK25_00645, partial [Gemmatimonadaceae bacterium]